MSSKWRLSDLGDITPPTHLTDVWGIFEGSVWQVEGLISLSALRVWLSFRTCTSKSSIVLHISLNFIWISVSYGFNTIWRELNRIISIWYVIHRMISIRYELHRISEAAHRNIIVLSKKWDESSCRNIIGHRRVAQPVHLAALWGPIALSTFTDIRYRSFGIDEWKTRCNLPPAGGKLYLQYLPQT